MSWFKFRNLSVIVNCVTKVTNSLRQGVKNIVVIIVIVDAEIKSLLLSERVSDMVTYWAVLDS